MKEDCDASIYGEILFIFINEKESKYFLNGGPKMLNKQTWKHKYINKPNVGLDMLTENLWTGNFEEENVLNTIIFTERRPGKSGTTE